MEQKKIKFLWVTEAGEPRAMARVQENLNAEGDPSVVVESLPAAVSKNDLLAAMEGFDAVFVAPELRETAGQTVSSRSVSSHFLGYADFLTFDGHRWWSQAIFPEVFSEILTGILQMQNYRGAALFLGLHPNIVPLVQVLARFGCRDVSILQTVETPSRSIAELRKATQGVFGLQLSTVDSAAFIQSQKEYSLCLVSESQYSQEVIEDMSYFHFLSPKSMIFDLVGQSNFQFDDVKALGVGLVEHEILLEAEVRWVLRRIRASLRDL